MSILGNHAVYVTVIYQNINGIHKSPWNITHVIQTFHFDFLHFYKKKRKKEDFNIVAHVHLKRTIIVFDGKNIAASQDWNYTARNVFLHIMRHLCTIQKYTWLLP